MRMGEVSDRSPCWAGVSEISSRVGGTGIGASAISARVGSRTPPLRMSWAWAIRPGTPLSSKSRADGSRLSGLTDATAALMVG